MLHLCWRSFRDGGFTYLKERLGYQHKDNHKRIHIHAASVGEVVTVLPLIEKMQKCHPAIAFLVTTNTPTGSAILRDRLAGNCIHTYLPIDFPGATRRFFATKNISSLWIVETEIWPWLFARAKHYSIPLCIVNARLSQKSNGAVAHFFAQTYSHALRDVRVLARSNEDASRFEQKGAKAKNISTIGNLKYAQTDQTQTAHALLARAYVLAASTHDDEELQLARAWLNSTVDCLLVIAPRHAERGAKLIKNLNALQQDRYPDLPCIARRSLGEHPGDNCKLYLADTLGEMHHWYTHATAAFVGGSLIKHGGHNVLEPARLKTPIVVGPHTANFDEEVTLLHKANAIAIADNVEQAIQLLLRAVSNDQWAQSLSEQAFATINTHDDVLDRYIASLAKTVSYNLQE